MADEAPAPRTHAPEGVAPLPSIADMQAWGTMLARAQQMMVDHAAKSGMTSLPAMPIAAWPGAGGAAGAPAMPDLAAVMKAGADFWADSLALWQRFATGAKPDDGASAVKDKRFAAPEWRDNPAFDMLRQTYQLIADHMLRAAATLPIADESKREQVKFATRALVDALSPSNFMMTNPVVLQRAMATQGESLLKGLRHMLTDLDNKQLTHVDPTAFALGRNIATTPGKVIHETLLYQLIHYAPTTDNVLATPLVIFPPWINRFYILDLNPEKSFVRWAVEQGISVFMVSWKSAGEATREVVWDDYIAAQIDAIDVVRDTLDVGATHAIGYCVAGTTLAATLAILDARGEEDKVKSATFFTAQVDFQDAGELKLMVDDAHLGLIDQLSAETGYLDGRYMVATFNSLRSRDLIWNYVVNNYLLGEDYPAFDLLHWNGDSTNLPAKWQRAYLTDLYRDNKLVEPGRMSALGTPIDLTRVTTPTYVQAGREDHIAPAQSVFAITRHFGGPMKFVLAGSGHIAGVVNPPAQGKYQYWLGDSKAASLDAFVAGASEIKGSWWPDWLAWLKQQDSTMVPATGARIPGEGSRKAIEDAPGRYVMTR